MGRGIALRTRAFLSTGTAFLIVNVLGQLTLLYPEQRRSRALILMTLSALVTAAMILFNLQWEVIVLRGHVFRADLAARG